MATQPFLQRFQRPPSPTLTNPDLILPDQGSAAQLRTDIPAFRQRPPSPSQLLRQPNSRSQFVTPYTQPQRNGSIVSSLGKKTPPHSRRSSNVEDRDELDATPKRSDYLTGAGTLGSSPTLREPDRLHANSFGQHMNSKRWSNTSSSVHSEDFESLESLKWPGFDSGADADEEDYGIELIDEDEEDQFGSFPEDESALGRTNGSDMRRTAGEDDDDDDDDDDPYSPNALSRRADMILANAKKRLNLFEGNLNSARHSLPVAQSMSMASLRAPPDMPSLPTPPREKVNYAGLAGPIDSSKSGHNRGFSEASASSFIQQLLVSRQQRKQQQTQQPPPRSVSALATHTQQNNQARNNQNQELMRENRIKSWVFSDAQESLASPSYSEGANSREEVKRSPSTTNDLRAQMNDLKGKISSLQQRAKDENLRRRSYASVRSQSAASFRNGSPLANEMNRSQSSLHDYKAKTARRLDHADSYGLNMPGGYADSQYDSEDEDALDQIDNESPEARAMLNETLSELDDGSAYETADDESVYESVFDDESGEPAARHEDRPDAFDYENFFLHSAMGSYTRERGDSVSSEDSVETTKPAVSAVPAAADGEAEDSMPGQDGASLALPLHKRYASSESIATLATFRTATEGGSDSDEDSDSDDNTALDHALSALPMTPQLAVPSATNQRDSGVSLSPTNDDVKPPTPTSSEPARATNAPSNSTAMVSSIDTTIAGSLTRLQDEDRLLVLALVQNLERVCLALKDADIGQDEGALLRKRLDEARQSLDSSREPQIQP